MQTPLESSDAVSPSESEGNVPCLSSSLVWLPCPSAEPAHQLQTATALQGENQCHAVTASASHSKTQASVNEFLAVKGLQHL